MMIRSMVYDGTEYAIWYLGQLSLGTYIRTPWSADSALMFLPLAPMIRLCFAIEVYGKNKRWML